VSSSESDTGDSIDEVEVLEWLHETGAAFMEAWRQRDITVLRNRNHPLGVVIGQDGRVTASRPSDEPPRDEGWIAMLAQLDAEGFDHEKLERHDIQMLGDAAAVVNAEWARYRADGAEYSRLLSTYLVAKTDGQWTLVARVSRPG
jgi:uncharacterized NTF2-like protein DUF6841